MRKLRSRSENGKFAAGVHLGTAGTLARSLESQGVVESEARKEKACVCAGCVARLQTEAEGQMTIYDAVMNSDRLSDETKRIFSEGYAKGSKCERRQELRNPDGAIHSSLSQVRRDDVHADADQDVE